MSVAAGQTRTGQELYVSRYLRTRASGEWVAVFHELRPVPFFVPAATWRRGAESPRSRPKWLTNALVGHRLLVASEAEDDIAFAEVELELSDRLDLPAILYLVLVQGCNFNCAYCPIPQIARQRGEFLMTAETVRAAIDLWADHIRGRPMPAAGFFVIFYGGEPLMNTPALGAGLTYIAELERRGVLPDHLNLLLATNGVLLDSATIALLRQHDVMTVVGCDGPEALHDAARRDQEDRPTFQAVARSIRTLVDSGVRTFASASITPASLDALAGFGRFFREFGIKGFGLNFLRGRLLLTMVDASELPAYYERATEGVIRNFDASTAGDPYEYQMDRKISAYFDRQFFPTDCNGYGNQLVVQADGQLGNCPFMRNDMGSVHALARDFRIADTPLARQWRQRLPLYNPACHDCDAKSICGGGCAWNAVELKGDPLAIDDAMCLLTKKLFDRFIWSERLPTERASGGS